MEPEVDVEVGRQPVALAPRSHLSLLATVPLPVSAVQAAE
jgi:hypothetical protein